jgi:hypothetical protein
VVERVDLVEAEHGLALGSWRPAHCSVCVAVAHDTDRAGIPDGPARLQGVREQPAPRGA